MPVTLILGKAGTGKTRFCLDAILDELEKPDEARRLVLLVPEQASFQMERMLALRSPRHGYWRAEVLSFSRLVRRVFDELGRAPEVLRPAARTLGLRSVAGAGDGVRKAFGASSNTPGFFAQLDRLIEELLRENISPEELSEAIEGIPTAAPKRRAAALARVYRDYLAWLGSERIDPADQLAVLREQLPAVTWLHDASIWVDGFAGFTGQELETLVALARVAREVAITLLLDPAAPAVRDVDRLPDPLNLFQRTETTYQRLVTRLTEESVELHAPRRLRPSVVPRFAQAPALARLESGLATPIGAGNGRPGDLTPYSQQVRLLEFDTHRAELRAAARFIRGRVHDSNGALHFRDFALIARDLEPFADVVAEVFAEYELPGFLDRRRSLGAHALARFVQSLFQAVLTDFSTGSAIRLLRCGLLPFSRDQAESLENRITANEVRGFDIWQRRRWAFEREVPSLESPADSLDEARLEVATALQPLLRLAKAQTTPTATAWARTLYETLVALRVPERIAMWIGQEQESSDWETAELHRLAWDSLCDLLDDLHVALGERPIGLAELANLVDSELHELTVGLAPPALDQVLISSIERSRHPDVKYAWVFAFNEGIFPARPPADTLLSPAERESLVAAGLPALRSRREDAFAERLLAYIALTRPAQGLTISYAKIGDDGEPRFASPLLDEVRGALPGLEAEAPSADEPPVCLPELARGYLDARAAAPPNAVSRRRYECLREQLRTSAASERFDWLLRGLAYENSPAPVVGYARPADSDAGAAWSGSPTELDEYLQCPFRHFAHRGLGLAAQRGPTPTVVELGIAAHEVIAAVTKRAIAAPEPLRALSDQQWLGFLEDALEESAARQPSDLATRRPRAAFLRTALRPFLRELLLAHAARWRRGEFEPLACEQRFDPTIRDRGLAALELEARDGQRIHVHGVVDRIDTCEHQGCTYLLAYDYKSSPRTVKADYLTRDRLQVFTYLLAVEQACAAGAQTRVAGVFLAPLYPRTDVVGRESPDGPTEAELRMHMYRPRGLFDEAVAPLLDRQLGQGNSPVAAMRLRKDGGFYQWSDATARADLEARLELARQTVRHAVEGITRGRIDVAPLLENKTLACNHCEFRSLCRFEPVFNRARVAESSLPTLRQLAARGAGGSR